MRTLGPILRRLGIEVQLGTEEALAWLALRGGEAETIADEDGATILFGSTTPSLSAVLEELAHTSQTYGRRYQDMDIRELSCRREVEAKKCMVDHREVLHIPAEEDEATRAQLEEHQNELKSYEEMIR